jgi:hypothetical protein
MNAIDAIIQPRVFKVRDLYTALIVWDKLKIRSVTPYIDSDTSDSPVAIKDLTDVNLAMDQTNKDSRNSKIIKPVKLLVRAMCDDITTLESMIDSFYDVESTFEITTKEFIADNMALTRIQIEQTPKIISANVIEFEMEQVEKTVMDQFDPKSPSDESTFGVKVQDPKATSISEGISNGVSTFTSSAEALYNKVLSYIG